ncbi:50S ribosomal protein L6 [Salimicrobium jeotgali]|uniref:Large ribosomal subunit protein uL6 n=2 Tax=Salimicrobium TaxID=351195 RepID=K2H3H6_9BACI|nr:MULTISPECIES: 50S ribosomal protein L6 [Salimicrobium]AKG05580.1 50S ribosomal protein L6 [Salimicrobium jeotgali]EKE30425.1 50S ribosomal protein L6 [Salimicrobium jeotgali]MBM7696568.1 large subunit ribosomal protein L6 [Salimicrobium jeotgali]PBB05231.1 50S ribosomal protein L6 [Salimicrobium humidisoli]
MSRIGVLPIELPEGVEVTQENSRVAVKGPKGELATTISDEMSVKQEDNVLTVERPSDKQEHKALHGTTRSLINNMVVGVSQGFEKALEIRGVGYRAQKQGEKVTVNAGYSHPVEIENREGIDIEVPTNTRIVIKGIDKELVGAVAANIRAIRPPEPYKGKGIRYENETVRTKEGKTAK